MARLDDLEVDEVLDDARRAGVLDMIWDWSDAYGWPRPETPEEVLAWLLEMIRHEVRAAESVWSAYEIAEARERVALFEEVVRRLRSLEVIPAVPPWVEERRRWGISGMGDLGILEITPRGAVLIDDMPWTTYRGDPLHAGDVHGDPRLVRDLQPEARRLMRLWTEVVPETRHSIFAPIARWFDDEPKGRVSVALFMHPVEPMARKRWGERHASHAEILALFEELADRVQTDMGREAEVSHWYGVPILVVDVRSGRDARKVVSFLHEATKFTEIERYVQVF